MSTWSVRLAKAKVAGSNPVFRSNLPGFRVVSGSGFFIAVARRGDAVGSQRFQAVVASVLLLTLSCVLACPSEAHVPLCGTRLEHSRARFSARLWRATRRS